MAFHRRGPPWWPLAEMARRTPSGSCIIESAVWQLMPGVAFLFAFHARQHCSERERLMDTRREIRYYASIPKITLLLLCFGSVTLASGWALESGYNSAGFWVLLVAFGLITLVPLTWLVLVAVFRQPILRVNGDGMIYSAPIKPWSHTVVRWEDVERIGIAKQGLSSGRMYHLTYYYLIVEVGDPERFVSTGLMSLNAAMYPALAKAAIVVAFSQLYFIASTHKQRERLLERIETTFAPEIIQYNVHVDRKERLI
jgi:hypothetical protein